MLLSEFECTRTILIKEQQQHHIFFIKKMKKITRPRQKDRLIVLYRDVRDCLCLGCRRTDDQFSPNVWRRVPQLNHNKPLAGTLGLSLKKLERTPKNFGQGKSSSGNLTFSESFHCRLLFSGKAKNSPRKFERFKPLLGRPNRSNFFSDANYSFILLLKHSRMHKEKCR